MDDDTKQEIRIMRFWSNVDKGGGPESCWLWTKSAGSHGYGQAIYPNGKLGTSHRLAWILTNGDPGTHVSPSGNVLTNRIRHMCPGGPNKLCCNPAHMTIGTDKENGEDRQHNPKDDYRGERMWQTKLTEQQVREIRQLRQDGWTQQELADKYDVHRCTIGPLLRGETWKHVD